MDSSPNEYECPSCGGSLIGQKDCIIRLVQPCARCAGTGKVDWVSNVVSSSIKSNKSSMEAERGAAMANIQLLRNLIIDEASKVGLHVIMNMEFKDMNEYLMKAASPMIIKGGKVNVPY